MAGIFDDQSIKRIRSAVRAVESMQGTAMPRMRQPRIWPGSSGRKTFANVAVITSSQTWKVPKGVKEIQIWAVGGGGGGGGGGNYYTIHEGEDYAVSFCGHGGGGGGGGGTVIANALVSPDDELSITIGTGGGGGSPGGGGGSNGGDTTVSGTLRGEAFAITAQGGRGASSGGAAGRGGWGTAPSEPFVGLVIPGNDGGYGSRGSAHDFTGNYVGLSGHGGATALGGAAHPSESVARGTGGVGGFGQRPGSSAQAGNTGKDGVVVIWY